VGRAQPRRSGVSPGSGVARVASAREGGVRHHRRGAGCSDNVRSSWWQWRRTSLYSVWKRCERGRSGRKKGWNLKVGSGGWGGGREERTSELITMEPDRSVLNKGVKKDGLETKHTMSMEE
jgi:hypothetical protein